MHAVGAPVRARLVTCYTISAAIAGIAGGLWAQANAYVNLSALGLDRAADGADHAGPRRLWPALRRLRRRRRLHGCCRTSSRKLYPTAWQLGLGLLLVVIALFARNGILGIRRRGRCAASARSAAAMTTPLLETRGAVQELRRARRRARHRLPARARRAPRADRPERRRQDHVRQSAHRRAAADRPASVLLNGRDITAVAQAERVKLGIARTFQINRLFRGLSVLENVYIAVAERLGAAPSMLQPAGKRQDVIDESMHLLETLKLHDHAAAPRLRAALWPAAAGRARDRARTEARGAAARRARRRRAQRREPHHPRRHRGAARSTSACSSSSTTWTSCSASPSASPCWWAARSSPKASPQEIGARRATCAPSISEPGRHPRQRERG